MRTFKIYILILIFCGCGTSKNTKTDICLHEVGIPSAIKINSETYSTSDYGIIRGQFLNRTDSLPIPNGLIKFTEFINIADENGKFSIDLPPHSYDVEFSFLGFNNISRTINIEKKEIVNIKIYLGIADSWTDFTTENPRKLKKKIRKQNRERKTKYGI